MSDARALDGIAYRPWIYKGQDPAAELLQEAGRRRVTTRCRFCRRRRTGSLEETRAWFKAHECKGRA